jgi:hypothetical protein
MTDKIVSYVADLHIVRINEEDFDIQHRLSERDWKGDAA